MVQLLALNLFLNNLRSQRFADLQIIQWHKNASKYFQYNIEVLALVWQLNDIIDTYYYNKLSKKTILQIEKKIAKDIFSRFNSF